MTEADAIDLLEFLTARLHGWNIVMAVDPKRGMIDGRTKRSKIASELLQDLWLNMPDFSQLLAAAKAEIDLPRLWPTDLQDTVRFRLNHIVPRGYNEPLSEYGNEMRVVHQGVHPWPDFLRQYAKPATVEDHPPFPPHSELYEAWKRTPYNPDERKSA